MTEKFSFDENCLNLELMKFILNCSNITQMNLLKSSLLFENTSDIPGAENSCICQTQVPPALASYISSAYLSQLMNLHIIHSTVYSDFLSCSLMPFSCFQDPIQETTLHLKPCLFRLLLCHENFS